MYSVVTLPQPERISSILQGTNRKLNQIDGRNDSQMIFYDQLIPGSTLLGYLNADHWAVVVPIARTHDTIGSLFVTQNAYPREALTEAVLRFVEEDLPRAASRSCRCESRPVPRPSGGADRRRASLCPRRPPHAWVYPEHRDIAVLAVEKLDAERKAQFDRLWGEARAGNEQRLCAQGADTQQGVTPACIDWAAFTAIAGDHSCSSRNMLDSTLTDRLDPPGRRRAAPSSRSISRRSSSRRVRM